MVLLIVCELHILMHIPRFYLYLCDVFREMFYEIISWIFSSLMPQHFEDFLLGLVSNPKEPHIHGTWALFLDRVICYTKSSTAKHHSVLVWLVSCDPSPLCNTNLYVLASLIFNNNAVNSASAAEHKVLPVLTFHTRHAYYYWWKYLCVSLVLMHPKKKYSPILLFVFSQINMMCVCVCVCLLPFILQGSPGPPFAEIGIRKSRPSGNPEGPRHYLFAW